MVTDRPAASLEALLARAGIDPASARGVLHTLGVWRDGPLPGFDALVDALADSANPDLALAAFERMAAHHEDAWTVLQADAALLGRAATLTGTSPALGNLLAVDPACLAMLRGPLEAWDAAAAAEAARRALADGPEASRALARVRRRGLLRVAARDLLGLASTPEVVAELSALADGVLHVALEVALAEVAPDARVAVIAMGKLGGRELNYVSDVDVLFAHDGDRTGATRVCERFLRLLGEVTPEGRAYEVDANLRPEGRDGPLTRQLEAFASYYERWAKTWEFQALLKARPCAGDPELGAAFLRLAGPFVWPDRLDAAAVEEIQRMKGVVESSREVQRDGSRQVKLAPGGLRDIEFAVQLLQLVHGRHDESLRSPNTLEALAALAEGGYVGEDDVTRFAHAYVFLRTVEHRLQLVQLRRTHTVPRDDAARRRLARAMGYRDGREADALAGFDAEFRRVRALVRRLHEKLFYRPLLARFAELGPEDHAPFAGGGRLAEEPARERLIAIGFRDADSALRHLGALAAGVSRRARLLRTLLPAVLPVLAAAPDPDGGLAAFRSLAERLGDSPTFLRTLRDTPPVAELLATVLGRSRLVGQWLERQPEVIGLLADSEGLQRALTGEDYRRLAWGLLRRGEEQDEASAGLQRLRRREAARIAVRDLGGMADAVAVGHELTALAEACFEAGLGMVVPEKVRLAVIGMGKFGGRELGWPSDLDVLLVYEPAEARSAALRAAERLLQVLREITPEGKAFRVDTGLRPEGKDGPLARSLDSYRTYYQRWAEPWELQALTQARPVAGDAELGAAFVEAVHGVVYPERVPPERLQAVRRMKARLERERAGGARRAPVGLRAAAGPRVAPQQPRAGDRVDLKLGAGGMSDVEWSVQLLQLRLGGPRPEVRVPGTLTGLEALSNAFALDERDVQWLADGYRLLLRLRNALYLMGRRDSSLLPPGATEQERLARVLGYAPPGRQALVEDLQRAMRRVRKVHERAFYDA